MTHDPIEISTANIRETLRVLRQARRRECVVLWLGRREKGTQRILDVYRPRQEADADFFHIPREGMQELMGRLREQRLYVASQVHTHPGEAFHSPADDRWAIVRHAGALSIVLPRFAVTTNEANFLSLAAVYQLDTSNAWRELEAPGLDAALRIVP